MHIRFLVLIICSLLHLHTACCEELKKTIGIFTYFVNGVPPWDPGSVKNGITGSEEAVIYLSEQLAKKGYQVIVFGNPPKDSRYSNEKANPRYVPLNFLYPSKLDFAVAWRMPWMGAALKSKADKVYLWPHDTNHQTIEQADIDAFEDVFWLTKWQRQQWVSTNSSLAKFNTIYGNGINLEDLEPITERTNPYSCIYGSNYARGLSILVDCWPTIKERFPKATLDIYYGWVHWGLLTPEQEASLREKIKNLADKGVNEHGLVGHKELHQAYSKASFWTYPCIAPETFCITALKAQASGAIPVIIDGTGLTETVRHGFKCSNADAYLSTLIEAMETAENTSLEARKKMKDFIIEEYTWDKIAENWKNTFEKSR